MIKLIAGLGNPERKYINTRHNIGYMLIDYILDKYEHTTEIDIMRDGYAELHKVKINNEDLYLLKPKMGMNYSGIPINYIKNWAGVKVNEILVIHDEIHLDKSKIKLKFGGSGGGNNGLKSIIENIGEDFWRLRFGIGKPENMSELLDYVLGEISEIESEAYSLVFEDIYNNLELMCFDQEKFQCNKNKKK